jgi:diguanylate cyclase (GGDEF)-like protein
LDIDYFKSINDIYGHEVGDEVLKLFSATIKNQIAPDDVIARFGGDEFVLILKNTANENHASDLIKNLSNALDTSFHINSNEVFISASIGASAYPKDGSNAKQLLKNADIAMYTAKNAGRNCYQFYSLKNSQKLEYEHALSHALQTILKNNNRDKNFQLVYQPLVNIDDNDFNECEALIRWKDKNGNNVNTSEFIQIAEKSNLIEKVNLFVIEEACRQQAEWQKQGIKNIRININLSGNKRIFEKLFESLAENVSRYNLDPKLFGIELTERTMYEISEKSIVNLTHFRDLGMKIAIDDFGTGYSSLSYLKDLPITSLKIDRKFTAGLPTEKVDIALVKSIITLAHSLDYDVIAEGVETQAQFDFLKSYKCNIAQGYLLHRPLSSEAISELKLAA